LDGDESIHKLARMKKIRLRTFVILSLAFHIILISALLAIFLPKRTITESNLYPISFGNLPKNEATHDAKDNSPNLIQLNVSKRKETQKNNRHKKIETSQANEHEKTVKKIEHQEEKTTEKKYVKTKIHVTSELAAREGESDHDNLATSQDGKDTDNEKTAQLSYRENMNHKSDPGVDSPNRNTELAFPDYKVNPKPRYPMLARRKGYEGTIILRVFVLESGGVGKVELEKSSGYEILDESALKAVKEWVFTPGKKDGEPVPSWVTVPIKFQLNSG
jgi:TonB family protein